MIVCDNCHVCVTKPTFCSDKCRQSHHRNKRSVTEALQEVQTPEKIKKGTIVPKKKAPPKIIKTKEDVDDSFAPQFLSKQHFARKGR